MRLGTICRSLLAAGLMLGALGAQAASHALAMHGEPKYGPDFQHFDYVNPDAPKGGTLRLAAVGTFDSLNNLILKGTPAAGLGYLYDTLTVKSDDEPFTQYGLLAETIEVPEDRSWVKFRLRPEARFHDGKPVRAEDVVFTFNTLREKGHPLFRVYWADVLSAEKTGPREVTFRFREGENRELPLIIGEMVVLPEHYWAGREFNQTTLEPPLGSGPYRVAQIDAGRAITFERDPNYWGRDLPVNRGRFNFGRIRYDFYRDRQVEMEAFKAGAYDLRLEYSAKNWATAYDIAAVRDGRMKKVEIPHQLSSGMQGFFYNTRRWVFQDPRVRQALNYAFDFEWTNANIFNGAYKRTESYFSNSELASRGLPGEPELALLNPYRDQVPPEVFTQEYHAPRTSGRGIARDNLRTASRMLRDAGWVITEDGRRVHEASGRPLSFEILLRDPSFERVVLPFVRNLERLGIATTVRTVDATQYQKRLETFDFDMTVYLVPQSLSPGNEQRHYWGSAAADTPGSRNVAGIKDPVVDALIEKLIAAPTREALVASTRALDRVLLWGHYVIPHYHINAFRLVYWDKFGRPEVSPAYGLPIETTWWSRRAE